MYGEKQNCVSDSVSATYVCTFEPVRYQSWWYAMESGSGGIWRVSRGLGLYIMGQISRGTSPTFFWFSNGMQRTITAAQKVGLNSDK